MWALLVQLISYMALVDLGMTSAVARLLVDHKDDRANGSYGSLLKASFLVSAAQGFLVLLLLFFAAPGVASLMKIPTEQAPDFILLLQIQGVITAFMYLSRPLNLILYAHQRMDLQTYLEIFNLVASLGLLILFLNGGNGIFSFVYANILTALIGPIYLFWSCKRLGLFPGGGEWGFVTRKQFREVFSYGYQIFLFNLGCQLQFASQTIVISRALGLESAAIWAVGTKMFNLIFPLMIRPYGAALPGLYEMVARGEMQQLKDRFRSIVQLTASLGAFLGGSFVLCNGLFIGIWTSGRILWPSLNDSLMAVWLLILSMQTTHCTFVNVTKRFGAMSYVLLAEGCCFILLALTFGNRWGIPSVVACSILCTFLFSYQYGLRRSCLFFHSSLKTIAIDWVKPSLRLATVYTLVVVSVCLCSAELEPFWRLVVHAIIVGTVGIGLFFRLGFPPELLSVVETRLPNVAVQLLSAMIRTKPLRSGSNLQ